MREFARTRTPLQWVMLVVGSVFIWTVVAFDAWQGKYFLAASEAVAYFGILVGSAWLAHRSRRA